MGISESSAGTDGVRRRSYGPCNVWNINAPSRLQRKVPFVLLRSFPIAESQPDFSSGAQNQILDPQNRVE